MVMLITTALATLIATPLLSLSVVRRNLYYFINYYYMNYYHCSPGGCPIGGPGGPTLLPAVVKMEYSFVL